MKRNEIWWASLPEATGSSPAFRRPVLIVQADAFNVSYIRTVIVLAITSNLRLANAPGNVLINAQKSGLSRDSVINVSQILTVDKEFLTDYVGTLSGRIMQQVEDGMRLALSL
ncbi:MAG: type II toxin-antitoxin system PemK/MazF family toxin [Anaerolineales bacterium]|nr:type II toxin-antitoxin system PemK/MazF family toxin [Anaerolineales bacterium]